MNKSIKLKDINIDDLPDIKKICYEEISTRDIAIIGMSGKFASAGSIDEFYASLRNGESLVGKISETRKKDTDTILRYMGIAEKEMNYYNGAFLYEIDKFDCNLFHISPKEASLMDPNQRIFLQTAWNAIEDSGYGGNKLKGSRTGVYVGYCGDFNEDYRKYVQLMDPSMAALSVAGNIKSIVASRISYLLDLKGPSMLIDTACSSTLVAVHSACQALRNGECETAIAGGIKIILLPVETDSQNGFGIDSSSGVTRAFDDYSDGTGFGEGVAAIVLKPLKKALEDRDNIYSIIKGSAVNQDGTSMGITAPNAKAQMDVITSAWKDAKIDPETISYIEAHGTGTNLGDPIEIDGIEMAFSKYTNRKQFCCVSSVKTNIGHLDSAAGIAGLIKAVLSIKHQELFQSLNFMKPNKKISFENSPVYVNDTLTKWESNDVPRRCGISSFGLSGTNCHLILEEPPQKKYISVESECSDYHVFTLSSQDENCLMNELKSYQKYLNRVDEASLGEICYTANTGRGHYNIRIAFVIENKNKLKDIIEKLISSGLEHAREYGVYFGLHKVTDFSKEERRDHEYFEEEIAAMSKQTEIYLNEVLNIPGQKKKVPLENICKLYVNGANVQWDKLYEDRQFTKVSLPGYSFMKKRCWIESDKVSSDSTLRADYQKIGKSMEHPLIDCHIVESMDMDVYCTLFRADKYWVFYEHKIGNHYVAPGTIYLEMIREVCRKYYGSSPVQMRRITFIHPLVLKEDVEKEVHIIVKNDGDSIEFTIASKQEENGQWLKHSTGSVARISEGAVNGYNFEKIKALCPNELNIGDLVSSEGQINLGPRWNTLKSMYTGDRMALAHFCLNERYVQDIGKYHMHPSLMDCAVNIANMSIGEGLYLPLSYESLKIYGTLPESFYSHLIRKNSISSDNEIATFDITLIDNNGNVLAQIEDYSVKKVRNTEFGMQYAKDSNKIFYKIGWVKQAVETVIPGNDQNTGVTVIFKDQYGIAEELAQKFRASGTEIVEVELGTLYEKIAPYRYLVGTSESDFNRLFSGLKDKRVNRIIYTWALCFDYDMDIDGLDETMERGVYCLHHLTKSISDNIHNDVEVVIIADYASEVVKTQEKINACSASVFAIGRVIGQEYENIKCRCIDIDKTSGADSIFMELGQKKTSFYVSFRDGQRYIQVMEGLTMDSFEPKKIEIKEQGVYIIAGGFGGIGLKVCRYLASRKKVVLVMINRSKLPDRSLWNSILRSDHKKVEWHDQKIIDRIRAIKEIENMGSKVLCYSADISNMDLLRKIFAEVRKDYVNINGVINLAGVFEEGILIRRDTDSLKKVIVPKVNGTLVLDKLTEQDHLDFFVMFSSISSFLGGHGQGDYAAANAFMDSFAEYKSRQAKGVISINWTGWKHVGMASQYNLEDTGRIFRLISKENAIDAFDRVIVDGLPRVIVGEMDYGFVAEYAQDNVYIEFTQEIKNELHTYKKNPREVKQPDTRKRILPSGNQNQEYTLMEQSLACIWGEVLGLDEVDIYEDLYNLGGDSIIALKIANEINKKLNENIKISDLFEFLSIHKLAAFLDERLNKTEVLVEESHRDIKEEHTLYELSNIQKRIWFLQRYDPQMTAYNLPLVSSIHVELDMGALRKAVDMLIKRHEVLRTVFGEENGEPYQKILDVYEYEPEFRDKSEEIEKETLIQQLIFWENRKLFDLTKPPMKIIVYKLNSSHYNVYINIHHIITDGWSMGIFLDELMQLYEGIVLSKAVNLEPLKFKYTDWVTQQHEWQESMEYAKMESYWMNELSKPLPVLNLPVDYVRPQMQTYNGSYLNFDIDQNTTLKLKEFAKLHNVTLNMALLSAYFVLLQKITMDQDIIVGLPVTGRETKEMENVMGVFINTLSVRVNFEHISSLSDLIECVREKCLNAYRNMKYPFDLIISKLNPERDLSRSPIFSTVFQFYDKIPPAVEGNSMFELSVLCREVENRIEIRAEFNTDLLKKETVERFATYFVNIIKTLIKNEDIKINDVEIISQDERNMILNNFNDTIREYNSDITIDHLFERQVKASLESNCLIQGNRIYTYTQINAMANQVARRLLKHGVMPGDIVGIMAERSCNMIIGILGILKAKGAYLPIDPTYPSERINYMLLDSSVNVLLTNTKLIGTVDFSGVSFDLDDLSLYTGNPKDLDLDSDSHSLAYVIYTSGSTGKPKGVMIEHRSVCNFIAGMTEKIEFTKDKTILAMTSISFDIFTLETLLPLCIGMKVVIADEEQQKEPKLINEIIRTNNVDMLQITPSRLQMLLIDSRGTSCLAMLKDLMVGGEAFSQSLVDEVKRYTKARIFNMYGPTETTIWSTIQELTDKGSIDIGKPIANTKVYVIRENGNLQPIGIPGELCIAGDGLARGYLNRPELTLEKFVENPFSPGEKMYKTGDLVRWLPDGNIEYIRRMDHQVKLRGYRIELGEIEELLLRYDGVKEVVVDMRGEDATSKCLVAYITAVRDLTESELKKYLEKELPQYMVPTHIMVLDKLPLTPNGKTDRKALPNPVSTHSNFYSFVDVANETEKILQNIYQDVLENPKVGVHDNFFELGGHSLKATILVSRIYKELGTEISLSTLFKTPTIRKISEYIDGLESSENQLTEPVEKSSNSNLTLDETNKAEIQNEIISQVSGLMWRQLNCLDRCFGILIGQHNDELLRLYKLFLGIKRSYNLKNYFGDIYSEQSFHNGYLVEKQVLQSFGLKANIKQADNLEGIHTVICNSIDKGKPVLVCFDEYYVFYSPYYLNKHTNHLAIIDGYDRSRRLYSIIDYNHLIHNESQKINYGHFNTTFETMEHIYSNINYNMEILIMERVQEVDINDLMQQFRGALDYIIEKNLPSEDLILINNIMDGQDSKLDAEVLNKLYFYLGSKELLLDTVVNCPTGFPKNLKDMAHMILEASSNLVNICSVHMARSKNLGKDSTISNDVQSIYNNSMNLFKSLENTDIIF